MKKMISIFLLIVLLSACVQKASSDGKDRPSSSGQLQVTGTQLCGEDGEAVILRGISLNSIALSERYINEECFRDISGVLGANVVRLPVYTWGVGNAGYCTGGDRQRFLDNIDKGVTYAEKSDMYVIIDWHVLSEGDPNTYIEDAKAFFETVSARYSSKKHVLYEICNEPNKVEWQDIRDYAEVIIPIIRKNDPDSVIIVGTPDWSKDVDKAADDPLEYGNLLYTLHFYSASHKQELRDKTEYALNKGLPVFVSEFGITSSSGNLPYDIEEADTWIDFLEEKNISYVMWQFSKVAEASAVIRFDCVKIKDITEDDLAQAGIWLVDKIKEK